MYREYLSIGSTPSDEACAQVGSDRYHRVYRHECVAFIGQLRRTHGPEPEGASLSIKANPHDFGTYHEVVCYYEADNPKAVEYAFKCESETPTEWDDEARKELDSKKVCHIAGCDHRTIGCVEVVARMEDSSSRRSSR